MSATPAPSTPVPALMAGYATREPPSASSEALGRHRFSAGDSVAWTRALSASGAHHGATATAASGATATGTIIRVVDDPSETRRLADATGRSSTLYIVRDELGREVVVSSAALTRLR